MTANSINTYLPNYVNFIALLVTRDADHNPPRATSEKDSGNIGRDKMAEEVEKPKETGTRPKTYKRKISIRTYIHTYIRIMWLC